ncbi:hypothetical protein ES703_104063 [subsurface metagenome]
MKLNKSQRDKLLKYLDEKWPTRKCTICGHSSWQIQDSVWEIREFQGGGMVIGGGSLIPVISIMCTYCGNTLLFNALHSGIIEGGKKQKKDE